MSSSSQLQAIGREYTGRADHGIAWLRLAAIGLFAGAEQLPPPRDHATAFFIVLGIYAVWSVALVWHTRRHSLSDPAAIVVMIIDILVITALDSLSGGPFSLTRLGYFFVPVAAAFRYQWRATLIVTVIVVAAYSLDPILNIGVNQGNVPGFVALHAGIVAWIGIACAALSAGISHRTRQIAGLVDDRERLVTEVLEAESRERRTLAEGLHDGPIQSLLAARHDLEAAAAHLPEDEGLVRADENLLEVVRELRSTIFELHPHVLEEVGLEAAVRQVAEVSAMRAGFELTLDLADLPRLHDQDRLLFSVARELLSNVVRHAGASHVTVALHDFDGERVLTVTDDGSGVDVKMLAERIIQGHIGLASQRVRLESSGGRLEVVPGPDRGTVASARLPGSPIGR
jgi:two-component system, NarL family, sensor kinase